MKNPLLTSKKTSSNQTQKRSGSTVITNRNLVNKQASLSQIQQPMQQKVAAPSDMILDQLNQRKLDVQKTTLNSAALQDHLMKNFNLSKMDPFKVKTTAQNKLPPRQSNLASSGQQIMSSGSQIQGGISMSAFNGFSNNNRLQNNSNSSQNRESVGLARQNTIQQQNPISKLLEDGSNKDELAYNDIEKKRIQYINKLSLAQRLGLVDKPALPLSQVQWREIEQVSLKRFNEKEPCPICYEDLRYQDQIILSCSHVFHKKCLESFERFMHNKGHEKACPICRKKDYDQKAYVEGQKRYLLKQIVRIQGLIRGFVTRNHFYENLKTRSYQPWNQALRKKFIGYKLSRIGKKQRDQMDKERQKIMDMVEKVDKSIEDTDKLLESFIPNMSRVFMQKRERELQLRGSSIKNEEEKLNKFWQDIKDRATTRGDKDCPICYNPYKTCRDIYLLNCTHMYHKLCLESFENFDIAQNKCCPMCRHLNYEKVSIKA